VTRLLAVSALAEVAGGESTLLRTLPILVRRGYAPKLAVPAPGPLQQAARERGISTAVLPIGPPERFEARALGGVAMAVTHAARADVVWLNGPSTQRLVPALAVTGRRAVLRVNNPLTAAPGWWRRRRYWDVVRALSVPSRATAEECIAAGAPAELVRVMTPPAWGDRRPEAQPRPAGELRVGFVGTLEPRKGVIDLIRAADSFLSEHPQVTLTLIGGPRPGDAGYADELRQAAAAVRGAERIVFRGQVPNGAEEIAGLDILVIPSHAEPMASVTGEAAAAGVPVVASDVGGLSEGVADGGLIVPPRDPRALAEAINALLADPGRRHELGERALAGSDRFDPERFAQSFDALFREIAP
jgi:glycosyltransferase involved in cell wall biosynthesis